MTSFLGGGRPGHASQTKEQHCDRILHLHTPVANDPLPSPTASLQDWRTSIFHCFPISHLFVNHWVPLRTPLVFRGLSLNVCFFWPSVLKLQAVHRSAHCWAVVLWRQWMLRYRPMTAHWCRNIPPTFSTHRGCWTPLCCSCSRWNCRSFSSETQWFQHISTSFTHFSFFIIFQGGGPQWLIFFGLRSQEIICSSTCRPSPRRKNPSLDARRTPPMPCLPRRKCWRTSAMCRRRPGRLNEGRNGKNMRQLRIRQSSWTSRCSADSFHCSWRVSGWKIDLSITILMSQTGRLVLDSWICAFNIVYK